MTNSISLSDLEAEVNSAREGFDGWARRDAADNTAACLNTWEIGMIAKPIGNIEDTSLLPNCESEI